MGGEVGRAIEKAGGAKFAQEVKDLLASHGSLDTAGGKVLPGQSRYFQCFLVLLSNLCTMKDRFTIYNLNICDKNT